MDNPGNSLADFCLFSFFAKLTNLLSKVSEMLILSLSCLLLYLFNFLIAFFYPSRTLLARFHAAAQKLTGETLEARQVKS